MEIQGKKKQEVSDTKIFVQSILSSKSSKMSPIGDNNLQTSDTANMIKHGASYTKLLDIYVDDIKLTLRQKRKLKIEFYRVCEFILTFTCAIFFVVIFLMLTGVVPTDNVAVLIGTFVSFLTVFIVIPHTVAKYLFNTDEEKYMTDIIRSVQEHDVEIRRGITEKR